MAKKKAIKKRLGRPPATKAAKTAKSLVSKKPEVTVPKKKVEIVVDKKSVKAEDTSETKSSVKLSKPLQAVYLKIRTLLGKVSTQDILARYDVGLEVNEVVGNRAKYGVDAIGDLSKALDVSANQLYTYQRISKTWETDQIQSLVKRKNTKGAALTYSHLEVLASVTKASDRHKLLEAVFDESLSVKELGSRAKKLAGGPRSNNKGPKIPDDPKGAINFTSKMCTLVAEASPSLKKVFAEMDTEETDLKAADIEKMTQCLELVHAAIKLLQAVESVMNDKSAELQSLHSSDDEEEDAGNVVSTSRSRKETADEDDEEEEFDEVTGLDVEEDDDDEDEVVDSDSKSDEEEDEEEDEDSEGELVVELDDEADVLDLDEDEEDLEDEDEDESTFAHATVGGDDDFSYDSTTEEEE